MKKIVLTFYYSVLTCYRGRLTAPGLYLGICVASGPPPIGHPFGTHRSSAFRFLSYFHRDISVAHFL